MCKHTVVLSTFIIILFVLQLLGGNIAPDDFVISLESMYDRSSRNFSARTITLTSEVAILHVSGVPYGHRWDCTIYAERCGCTSISDITTLSKYKIHFMNEILSPYLRISIAKERVCNTHTV